MVTFKTIIKVYLDGKLVGEIRGNDDDGWQYFPKGSRAGGTVFSTRYACKSYLLADSS